MPFDTLWINASGGVPAYSANELRAAMALAMQYGGRAVGARQGVRPGGTPFLVTVDGSLNITVKAGVALVDPGLSTPQGPYWVAMVADDTTTLDVTAHDPTNPRIDIVYVRVRDDDEDGSGLRQAELGYLAGTPAGSPAQPATPASALLLASLAVPALSGAVAVTMRRVWAAATGGIMLVNDNADRDALITPYEGEHVYNLNTDVVNHYNGSVWVDDGFRLLTTVYFTGSGTFSKATYPGLRAIEVECVGGGGGGGGAAAASGANCAVGSGGGGGAYARKFVLAASLGTNETVTVGAGGAGGAAGANNGAAGGTTSLGAHCSANGGALGSGGAAGTGAASVSGGVGGTTATGDLIVPGGDGGNGTRNLGFFVQLGYGGATVWAGSQRPANSVTGFAGQPGQNYGGGGTGGFDVGANNTAQVGGDGALGIVIVRVFV